jgi:serine/threonine protein kinase
MGEVYRARDSRLRREVALKILPANVAGDLDRRARFEQEAHAAAALNHPNILAIYDVGGADDVSYITSELVSGITLATEMERGAMPVRALLDIAVQIADGLASAHAAHIVHRDLKPANVMITSDSRIKILDFGLAKQSVVASGVDETIATNHTVPGTIVGTVSYMSPEQACGKTGRSPVGPVLIRAHALRDGRRQKGIRRARIGADAGGDRVQRATAARRTRAGAAPLDHRSLPGQESGTPLRLDP